VTAAHPAEGVCSRCHGLVPVGDTYEHDGDRYHRKERRKGGAPCGPVFTSFEYRIVWQVHDRLILPVPLVSLEQTRALEESLEEQIPSSPERIGRPRVCLLIQERIHRP
jgi:hypothetical protein